MGVNWVITGHSERRQYFGETNEVVGTKTLNALKADLNVVACIGEKLEHRDSNQTFNVVQEQLEAIQVFYSIIFQKNLEESHWSKVVLAYEPVWAIGTGKVASPE